MELPFPVSESLWEEPAWLCIYLLGGYIRFGYFISIKWKKMLSNQLDMWDWSLGVRSGLQIKSSKSLLLMISSAMRLHKIKRLNMERKRWNVKTAINSPAVRYWRDEQGRLRGRCQISGRNSRSVCYSGNKVEKIFPKVKLIILLLWIG